MKIVIKDIKIVSVPYEGQQFKVDYEIEDEHGKVIGQANFKRIRGEEMRNYILQKVTNAAIKKYKATKKTREEQRELDSLKGQEIPPVYILSQKLEEK